MNALDVGSLRHRLAIQAPTRTPDGYGQAVLSWSTVASRWASVEPLSGRELSQAAQVQADCTHRVRLRWYSGLTPDMRFVLSTGEVFQITEALDNEETHRFQDCLCKQVL